MTITRYAASGLVAALIFAMNCHTTHANLFSHSASASTDGPEVESPRRTIDRAQVSTYDVEQVDENFKHDATLQADSPIKIYATQGDMFFIENCGMISFADENLIPVNVGAGSSDIELDSSVFTIIDHACEDSVVLISKVDGLLQRAVKTNLITGERVYASCFGDGHGCTTYTEYDIDIDRLNEFTYGESPIIIDDVDASPGDTSEYQPSSSIRRRRVGRGDRHLGERSDISTKTTKIQFNASSFSRQNTFRRRRGLQERCREKTVVRLALRYDSGFCGMHGSFKPTAEAYLKFIVAGMNEWFGVTGLCHKIEICSLEGHCNGRGGSDPYRDLVEGASVVCGGNSGRTLIDTFRQSVYRFGRIPSSLSQCDVVHFIYGRGRFGQRPFHTQTVGCAFTGSACSSYGIGVDYFGYTTNEHLHTVLLAHEIGHNLNATHTASNDLRYIMRPAVCGRCDMFSPQSVESIVDFTRSRRSNTCLDIERIELPPPTDRPTSAPVATTSDDVNCSTIGSSRLCNFAPGQTCTWTRFGSCQRREETACFFYSGQSQCNDHGSSRNCRWNSLVRVCLSAQEDPDFDYCSIYDNASECKHSHVGTCGWISSKNQCVHVGLLPCSVHQTERACGGTCIWDKHKRICGNVRPSSISTEISSSRSKSSIKTSFKSSSKSGSKTSKKATKATTSSESGRHS